LMQEIASALRAPLTINQLVPDSIVKLFAGMGVVVVAAIAVIIFVLFIASIASAVKSHVERRLPRHLGKLVDEILAGAQPSLGSARSAYPASVLKASRNLKAALVPQGGAPEPLLWELGNAIGEACRHNGYHEGVKIGARPDDKIRIDISLADLLHMSWLAHLGFQHMMPNYRGIEIHRFSGEDDAREAARSVALLECAIPKTDRPFADVKTQMLARDTMISGWWTAKPALRSAG
jgi:hypothetical protein